MSWLFLILAIGGVVGGLVQTLPATNPYVHRVSGGLIALGFLGIILWAFFLSGVTAGLWMTR